MSYRQRDEALRSNLSGRRVRRDHVVHAARSDAGVRAGQLLRVLSGRPVPGRRHRRRVWPRWLDLRALSAREHVLARRLQRLQPDGRRLRHGGRLRCGWFCDGWWRGRRVGHGGRNGGRLHDRWWNGERRRRGWRNRDGRWKCDGWRSGDGRRVCFGGRLRGWWVRGWWVRGWWLGDLRRHARRMFEHVRRPALEPRALRWLRARVWSGRGLQPRNVSGAAARLHDGARLRPGLLLRPHQPSVHGGLPPHRRLPHGRDVQRGDVSVPVGTTRVRPAVRL